MKKGNLCNSTKKRSLLKPIKKYEKSDHLIVYLAVL